MSSANIKVLIRATLQVKTTKSCKFWKHSHLNNIKYLSLGSAFIRSFTTITENHPELKPPKAREAFAIEHTKKKGIVYDKKPFKYDCLEGKIYYWCSCGLSKSQPFCDATHKNPHYRTKLRPVKFVAEETRGYWFCNCKQTKNPPYCDGTHKTPDVQDFSSIVKN